ncbi:hypothetical protein Q7421_11390 [Glaesserella parasuis]|nr:hypothetical protein [Glaesserella parasuis]
MRRKGLAALVTVLVMMLMTYIYFLGAFTILFAVFDFILSDGNINEYILELKELAELSVIPSIAVGIWYLILIFYKF